MFEPLYDDKPEGPSDDAAAGAPPGRQPVAPAASDAAPGPAAGADRAHIEPAGARGCTTPLPAFDGQ
jgi:hypothetical protein